ncbi:MAG: cytochrome P450 [Deltaproteobacteria bacterium]|nr:cytochrome P450 [Deltaproteobacteria bacterium]MBW2361539.1 cytochrome P450 [Deltaproteobacteria bacterium]
MASEPLNLENLELIDPDYYVDNGYPHDAWTALRREAPIFWYERNEAMPFWAVTKQSDIRWISRQPELFSQNPTIAIMTDRQPAGEDFQPPPTIIQMDPPKHGPYRQLISRRFTPRALLKIQDDIEQIAEEIIDGLGEGGDEGECDFVQKVAAPLPIAVIAWLLGVPKEDWDMLFQWTNQTIGSSDPEYRQPGETPIQTSQRAMAELYGYFAEMAKQRRKNPKDDMITFLAQAKVDGAPMSEADLLAYYMVIVVAGNETTRNATTGGMLAFIEHPEEFSRLQRDPELLHPAVEEAVRWVSPLIHMVRTATEDVEIRGQKVRAGQQVAMFYPSANRDEEVFEDPFTFRIDRVPNAHLSFGVGEHYCAGAHVARLELRVAFRHLARRLEHVELAGQPQRLRSSLVGGIKHLPIRYKLRPKA